MKDQEKKTYEEERLHASAVKKWNENQDLRNEFMCFEDFAAFEKAQASGRVNVRGLSRG